MKYRIRTLTIWLDPLYHSWQDAAEALRLLGDDHWIQPATH